MPDVDAEGAAWATELVAAVPEASALVHQHREAHDGAVLLHSLVDEVTRFVEDAHLEQDVALVQRCLAYLDDSLRLGSPSIRKTISVSFVEAGALWDFPGLPFVRQWPDALRAEATKYLGDELLGS